MQKFSDLYRLHMTLFGMYILVETLQNFISVHAASTIAIQTHVSFEKFDLLIKKTDTLKYSIRHLKRQLININMLEPFSRVSKFGSDSELLTGINQTQLRCTLNL